ncbi:MAG: hypothetical protein HQK77_18950 [Desulfobacterales bacterium]|nr:hypothetical protein [Desulfobacterales bacterium]
MIKRNNAQRDWLIPFMNFVDMFRYYKDISIVREPLILNHNRFDALLAATTCYLCHEIGFEIPNWVDDVPMSQQAWYLTPYDRLKPFITIECPIWFKVYNIFVCRNFLHRV